MRSDFNFRQPLVFIDLEMSGPDPLRHQITEIAAVKADPKNFGALDKFYSRCGAAKDKTPTKVFAEANPVAIKKTGLTVEHLMVSKSPDVVLGEFQKWLPKEYIFVGYNLMLDFMFIRRVCTPELRFKYRFIDITTLVELYLAFNDDSKVGYSLSLDGAAKMFGITNAHMHSAAADVDVCHKLFKSLINSIFTEKSGE